ncbi:MAG: O-6-methylguanine methyltransferase, partial [Gammaproteobacteria bacterium]|nr:O-6-methylguanine methyltransferase [Gammaproteobacteria bacterium]
TPMNARSKQVPRNPATNDCDWRWEAVVARDRQADGKFFYSVKTTGVYCRSSCPSRLAKRENVAFYTTQAEAENAGFRPCKRCKPGKPSLSESRVAVVAKVCRRIEEAETPPSLTALACEANMSPYHFHRQFKTVTGLTPKQYGIAHRADRLRSQLRRGRTVTEAIFDAGFNSGGRFYETSDEVLGMTPSAFRAGGRNTNIRFAIGQSSLGSILVAKSDKGVCAILLGDDPETLVRDLEDRFPEANLVGGDEEFEKWVSKVVGFVEALGTGLELPLDIRGTAFQQRVWNALRKVPSGSTASYTDIAKRVGSPKSVRAVAQACGANAIAVAIPCHRVVRNDGALSGYRWGVERKRTLLEHGAAL